MTVILYPTDPRQEAGFYRFLFAALRRHAGARLASGPRPLPRLEQPRQHESVWIEWDGARILMDMSDHVFLFDLPALERCDLYFKANLNPALARKILVRAGLENHAAKLRPYLFLPPTLAGCARLERCLRPLRRGNGRPFDFCHVVASTRIPFSPGCPRKRPATSPRIRGPAISGHAARSSGPCRPAA